MLTSGRVATAALASRRRNQSAWIFLKANNLRLTKAIVSPKSRLAIYASNNANEHRVLDRNCASLGERRPSWLGATASSGRRLVCLMAENYICHKRTRTRYSITSGSLPLPLQSSLMSKTYLKSDHFSGGGSPAPSQARWTRGAMDPLIYINLALQNFKENRRD
jgi:hypothetical protein